MKTDQVKKINYAYLLGYILIPLAVAALSLFIGWMSFQSGEFKTAACTATVPLLAILWWAFAARRIYRLGEKRMVRRLDEMGIDCRQIFYSDSCAVSIDMERGRLGLLFFWNPFQVQVVSVGLVTKAWTDDGARGFGFLRGSSRVSFLFMLDGVKIRVNTFVSNRKWKMTDDKILEGISKADMWVHILDRARRQRTGV